MEENMCLHQYVRCHTRAYGGTQRSVSVYTRACVFLRADPLILDHLEDSRPCGRQNGCVYPSAQCLQKVNVVGGGDRREHSGAVQNEAERADRRLQRRLLSPLSLTLCLQRQQGKRGTAGDLPLSNGKSPRDKPELQFVWRDLLDLTSPRSVSRFLSVMEFPATSTSCPLPLEPPCPLPCPGLIIRRALRGPGTTSHLCPYTAPRPHYEPATNEECKEQFSHARRTQLQLPLLVGQRRAIVGQTFRQSGGVEGGLLGAGR
ncbi:unnamed protein product [Pleuronectes platessa]|uniref:Uncharacterized protein n=1 Tax=Pleuronectes platessa TaxID=8262 RepID=A0A9N7Z2L4_PLEPL|nr:unnamed protein product [Pleuronectes platessa]